MESLPSQTQFRGIVIDHDEGEVTGVCYPVTKGN